MEHTPVPRTGLPFFLGIVYLFVGNMDAVHTLAYKGMGVFLSYSSNLPTQLWIASRTMESLSLLPVSLIAGRKIRPIPILAGYTLATALLLILIFSGLFPACYIDGIGITPFKKISEYSISKARFINKAGCEILGCSKNEIMGRNWFNTFTPETIREKVRNDWRKRIEGKIELPKYFEEPLILKNDKQRIISWHTSLIHNDRGSVVLTLCSGEDITELKAIENRLRRRNRELQALNIIGSKLSESLIKKEILDMSLNGGLPATGAGGGLIYLYDQKSKKNMLAAFCVPLKTGETST